MGKKERKKGSNKRDDDKGHKNEDRPVGRNNAAKKLHKGRNWKADKDDPIRKAIEAGKCILRDDSFIVQSTLNDASPFLLRRRISNDP